MTRFLSVCSGIEAASAALGMLGFESVGFAEIDGAAAHVLAHRYGSNLPGEPPSKNGTPNFGDFTLIDPEAVGRVDWLIGGTPCQAFSIAGKRLSLADARGNLTLAYAVLAHDLVRYAGLRNALWENVPGCLSTRDNAFGCFLGALVGDRAFVPPGNAGWPNAGMVSGPRARAAWRILDAQYFRLAQRRKRVFVVVDFGGGADPAEVLFERQGVRGNSPPRREAREGIAGTFGARTAGGGGLGTHLELGGGLVTAFGGNDTRGPDDVAAALNAHGGPAGRLDFEGETSIACEVADSLTVGANQTTGFVGDVIAHALRGEGFDASEDGTGRGTPLVPVALPADLAGPLSANGGTRRKHGFGLGQQDWESGYAVPVIAFTSKDHGADAGGLAPTLRGMGHAASHANGGGQVAVAYALHADALGRSGEADTPSPDAAGHVRLRPPGLGVAADVAFAIQERAGAGNAASGPQGLGVREGVAFTIEARTTPQAVAFELRGREGGAVFEGPHDTANIRAADGGGSRSYVADRWAVRRLLPIECERLQGFPDGHTLVPNDQGKPMADGPRYKMLGNSMAVPVIAWIGRQILAAMP